MIRSWLKEIIREVLKEQPVNDEMRVICHDRDKVTVEFECCVFEVFCMKAETKDSENKVV